MVTNVKLPGLLTVKQAAKELGISKCSVYRWVKRRWIAHAKMPNGTIRIPRTSVNKILSAKIILAGK